MNDLFKEVKSDKCEIFVADRCLIGSGVVLGPRCRNIRLGYGSIIGRDVYIDVEDLVVGEYTTIHHGSILHGVDTRIGHNCWIGHYTIIDSLGGETRIGNNVGIGAHSQLWSHMKFGDILHGCRWNSAGTLILEDDVWLVGHSIVGPIKARQKSMLMTGGVAVKDMDENHIYAGTPAIDVTDKFGKQFDSVSSAEKLIMFESLKNEFHISTGIDVTRFSAVSNFTETRRVTEFVVDAREYKPIRSDEEYQFMKFMLYDKAKFVPYNSR